MNDQDHLKTLETLKDDLRTTCSGCEVCGFEGDESCLTDRSRNVKDALSFAISAIERNNEMRELLEAAGYIGIGVDQSQGFQIERDWDGDSRFWLIDVPGIDHQRYDSALDAWAPVKKGEA